jgi:hypothetical protein
MRRATQGRKPTRWSRMRSRKPSANVPRVVSGDAAVVSMSRSPNPAVYRTTKWTEEVRITQTAADVFSGFDYRLDFTPAVNFAGLFQMYRIVQVESFFRPMFRANPVSLTTYVMPLLVVAVDPNDISSWTVFSQAQAAENAVVMGDDTPFCVKFRPQVQGALQAATLVTAASSLNTWVNCDETSIRHYGLKYAITGAGGGATVFQSWIVQHRYTVEFRISR